MEQLEKWARERKDSQMAKTHHNGRTGKAMDTLLKASKDDPDPVTMFTSVDQRGVHQASVVVLRGPAVVEMFRQWAERNGIYNRDNGPDGKPHHGEID